MENYFNYHKILKSGYLYYEEKDSRQTFILTENLGHFSTEGVTAPSISSRRRIINTFSSEDKKYLCIDEEN